MKSDNGAAQERLSQVADHMGGASKTSGKKGKSSLLEKNPDDVSMIRFTLRDERIEQRQLFKSQGHHCIENTLLTFSRSS
jgi:hypothetical protein